jgi:fructose-1,6-bisphosphatase I
MFKSTLDRIIFYIKTKIYLMNKVKRMNDIITSIKQSAIQIRNLIQNGDTSKSLNENSTGDTQLKLDIQSDIIIENNFKNINTIKQIVSEEQNEIKNINKNGKYLIAYDPLDGSSLVDVNLSIGSIFGIYKDEFKGSNIICAIYVVYGPRVELVISYNKEVELYRLKNETFNFIKNIKLNEKGNLNSCGGTQKSWFEYHKILMNNIFKDGYRLRYSGAMVADLHQILLKGGGIFSYPGTKDKPNGKLRQLFEIFPFAFIYENALGQATNGIIRVLDIKTKHIHDTSPCFFGSNIEINRLKEVYNKNAK